MTVGTFAKDPSTEPRRIWVIGDAMKMDGYRGSFDIAKPSRRVRKGILKLRLACLRYFR